MTFSFETSKKRTKNFPKKLVLWKFYCFVAHGYEHDEKRKKKNLFVPHIQQQNPYCHDNET